VKSDRRILKATSRNDWDTYWRDHELPDYINHTPQIITTIKSHIDLNGCRILEIGVGTGGNSSTLAALGANVTAIDFSAPALQRVIKTAAQANVSLGLVQGNAYQLPFASGQFDMIFHQGFLEHFENPEYLVYEQKRILRKGGHILIDVPQRYNWYTVHKHRLMRTKQWPYGGWEREFSLRELRRLLNKTGFRVIDAYGRGYYPRAFRMVRNLAKIEKKYLKRGILSENIWLKYDRCWESFEKTVLGCYLLQSVGILAQLSE
jgi:2-polyprenyl-3-methyl-5-hydroxy-6-metoxy-1,4-benzoquinol methylase